MQRLVDKVCAVFVLAVTGLTLVTSQARGPITVRNVLLLRRWKGSG